MGLMYAEQSINCQTKSIGNHTVSQNHGGDPEATHSAFSAALPAATMPPRFYTLIAAQFFSALADNAFEPKLKELSKPVPKAADYALQLCPKGDPDCTQPKAVLRYSKRKGSFTYDGPGKKKQPPPEEGAAAGGGE